VDIPALIAFLLSAMFISLSGALMPGPVTAVTVAKAGRSPHAGAWIALGHGAVEFPVMALIYFGFGALFKIQGVKLGIGILGGALLIWMGIDMLRSYRRAKVSESSYSFSPFTAGAVLSAGNPYFLVWWATVGAVLVSKSLAFGLVGFILLAICHWLCDLGWLYFLSFLTNRGGQFFGQKLQKGVFVLCGLALIYFGGYFISGAALTVHDLLAGM
jgi:threonine/homoserine/homoserine lactone efflux protein